MTEMMRLRYFLLVLSLSIAISACSIEKQVLMPQFENAQSLVDRGTRHLMLGDLRRAEAEFSLALEFAPLAAAVDGLGCVAMLREDLNGAERFFIRAYEMDRTYNHSLANLALLNELRGNAGKAEELYRKELELEPEDFRARHNYAAMRHTAGAGKEEVKRLLLQAQAIAVHPIIEENLAYLNGEE